jgi:hypothetical protein
MVYARISPNDPFIRPILPILPNPTGATVAVVAAERTIFDEALQAFHTCNLVERIIVQQINTALDDDILPNIWSMMSLAFLKVQFPKFSNPSIQDIRKDFSPSPRKDTEAIVYNHSRPIVNPFTQINKYAQMADHAGASATQAQLIDFGTIVLTASITRFASDLRKWQAKSHQNSTKPGRPSKHISLKHKRPSMTVNLLSQPIR